MSKIFISYRRGDNPDGVARIYERLKKLLPTWEIFYDHHSIDLGTEFPDKIKQAVTDAEFVLVVIGAKWLELLKQRKESGELDYVHEEIRTAFETKSGVIPVTVANATFPTESDLSEFPGIKGLANLNGQKVRPEPDFDKDMEALVGYLESRGPGVIVGSVLPGDYKLTREVGCGGMGIVYEAMQTNPNRRVAIKLIKAGQDTREVLARFDSERQALAMMEHENIAQVFDVGKSFSHRPFFVMEFVNGVPITEYCNEEKLSVRDRLELFRKVCAAVQHAHQKGVLHRDITPNNVLVTEKDGVPIPKVIDFGLAKALGGKLSHHSFMTQLQTAVGTLGYSSPEQAAGKDVDTTTDIYSLGALLYEMLVGAPPFDVEELKSAGEDAMRRHIIHREPVKPSTKFSSSGARTVDISQQRQIDPTKLQKILKGELDWVIMKALEKDRNRRYGTANDFASDIGRYLNNEAVDACPPSASYRFSKFVRKNRGLVASIAAIGLLLVAGVIGTSYGLLKARQKTAEAVMQESEANKQRKAAVQNAKFASDAEKLAEAESERASKSEAATKLQLANARWDSNRVTQARDMLHQIPTKYRDNFEWRYCNRHFLGSDITCYGHRSRVLSVAFSPTSSLVASGSDDATIKIWDATTGKEVFTFNGHSDGVHSVAFSPDGSRLVSGSWDNTAKIWNTTTGKELTSLKGHKEGVVSVAFSPNGGIVASGSHDNSVKIWNASTGKEITTFHGHTRIVTSVAFSPNGTRVISGGSDGQVKVWEASTAREYFTLKFGGSAIDSVAFSPDGRQILAGDIHGGMQVWDTSTSKEIFSLDSLDGGNAESVAFSPDGTRLVSGEADGEVKILDAVTGREITTLRGHADRVHSVAFNADGSRIVSGSKDNTVKIWDATTGQEAISMRGHRSPIWSVAFSPDGTRLASGSFDRTVKIWNASNFEEDIECNGHESRVDSVAFSPDGTRVVSGSVDTTVRIWDAFSGKEVLTFKGHNNCVNSAAFSPDGRRVVSAAADSKARIWDTVTGKETVTLEGSTGVRGVVFSPDGGRVVGAVRTKVSLWDALTGEECVTFKGNGDFVRSVVFSPGGGRVAGALGNTVSVWDTLTGKETVTFKGHSKIVSSVAFSPDGGRVVSGGKTVRIWDALTGQELATLNGGPKGVQSVAFSPDGERVILGSYDKTVKVLGAPKCQEIAVLKGHTNVVTAVTLSSDGTKVFSESGREKIVWNVETGSQIKDAKWNPAKPTNTISEDGRWLVASDGNNVILIDLAFKNTPREKAYRASKARFNPWWHVDEAKSHGYDKNWFAATFHYAWLVKNDSENAELRNELRSVHQKLDEEFKKSDRELDDVVPPVVRKSMELISKYNIEDALEPYQTDLEARKALAFSAPKDAQKQLNLSLSYNELGDVYLKLGLAEDALERYQAGLKINEAWAASNTEDAQKQREQMVSHYKIGAAFLKLEDYQAAKATYLKGIAVLDRMIANGQLLEQSKKEKKILTAQIAKCEKAEISEPDSN